MAGMSFKVNRNDGQFHLNDSFYRLSERNKKFVLKSWAKEFAEVVFPAINEERFSVLYSEVESSRPNTPVNIVVGGLILKEWSGLSDDDIIASICCDVRYQYALHTTNLEEQPVSDRTFSRFRERLYAYEQETGRDLLAEEMASLAEVFADFMKLTRNLKRMDSMMVATHSKRMSRLEIIYQVNSNAVRLIHRLGEEELLPQELHHYLEADDLNRVIYDSRGEEVKPRLEKALKESEILLEIMKPEEWHGFEEYTHLKRVIKEQGKKNEAGEIIPKENQEIKPDSMQNPSDPDATYRKKAGEDYKGYTANLVETVGENGDSVITDVDLKQNTHSDSEFFKEYVESKPEDAPPETVITDGAFDGAENREKAAEKNVTLVTTSLTGTAPEGIFAKFEMSDDGRTVTACPAGYAPEKVTYSEKSGACRVLMCKNCCANCPHRNECHAKEQRKNFVVRVSKTTVDRAKYAEGLSGEVMQKLARIRNAVEGVPSVLRRRYHVDEIPVFGYIRTKMFFRLKVAAYNFGKVLRYSRRTGAYCAQNQETA